MKTVLVCGGGGFLGHHLVRRLKAQEEVFIRCLDTKKPLYSKSEADEFKIGDLTSERFCKNNFHHKRNGFDEVYQFAANTGNSRYVSNPANDNAILVNNFKINDNACKFTKEYGCGEIIFASSNSVYSEHNQMNPNLVITKEETVFPAAPISTAGWSNILSEKLYKSYDIYSKILRYGNVFGPEENLDSQHCGVISDFCKHIANTNNGGKIKIQGDGEQTRNFLHIDDCIDATLLVSSSNITEPINVGSENSITINNLCKKMLSLAGKVLDIERESSNTGCHYASCDSSLIRNRLKWTEQSSFDSALQQTYNWVKEQGA
jgi:nucleoside-diphosphate-sugar epimerase